MELPKVIYKTEAEIDVIINSIKDSALLDSVKDCAIQCIRLAMWFPLQLEKKTISLSRLRKLLFGKGYSGKKKRKPPSDHPDINEKNGNQQENASKEPEQQLPQKQENASNEEAPKNKKPGHGRMPHTVYEHYTEITLPLNGIKEGEPCPAQCGGKMKMFDPGILVRITGQNNADVKKYIVEKLRCNLCDLVVSADIPPDVGEEKYHPSFKAMLAIQKYFAGMPFHRQERVQQMLGFPLPDATQWYLMEQLGGSCFAPYHVLEKQAGNGSIVFNDDTHVKIQEVIKELNANPNVKRRGMYTTGIIAEFEGNKIALFINGTQHAGENLSDVLKYRKPDKTPPIQMCDASNNNIPKEFSSILCNCLSHAFRKFEELVDFCTNECLIVMKKISQVYEHDEKTKNITAEERLAYHQEHSKPVMEELKTYLDTQMNEKLVEPSSDLGKSVKYMLKNWEKLTRFLTVAGAPLDNNVVERALKIAIRIRKGAMFFRTRYSAKIGGVITSLIYTCYLAGENAFDYLTVLQLYKNFVLVSPAQWLPWNYRDTLIKVKEEAATIPLADAVAA